MLAARRRLTTPDEFRTCVRRGRRSGGPLLVVHLLVPDLGDGPPPSGDDAGATPRAGFVVSRAVGNAVTRNLVKRRLRHLVAERLDSLPAGSLLVVRALPPAATASYTELGGALDHSLQRCLAQEGMTG